MNYQKELEKVISEIKDRQQVPRLLLHSCCAPCSSYVLEYLSEYFAITVYYYNPNFEKSVKLPNNDVITIKYPTIGTDLQIKKKMNDPNVIGGIHYVLMSIASHIDTINSKKIGLFESYEYVNNLDPDTYEAFVNFLLTVKFGCTGKVKHTCQCGNTGFYDLDLSSDFFIPKEN